MMNDTAKRRRIKIGLLVSHLEDDFDDDFDDYFSEDDQV